MKSASLLWQLFSLAFEILIFLYFCTRIRRLALETKIEKFSDSLGKLRFFFNLKLSLDFWKTACFKHPLKKQKQNPKYLLCWELQVPYTRSCVSPRSSTFQGSHYWARRLEHPMACVSTLSLLLWDFVPQLKIMLFLDEQRMLVRTINCFVWSGTSTLLGSLSQY